MLDGRIVALRREGAAMIARVDAGPGFDVHLTPASVQSLALEPGRRVWLVIKTFSWRVSTARSPWSS